MLHVTFVQSLMPLVRRPKSSFAQSRSQSLFPDYFPSIEVQLTHRYLEERDLFLGLKVSF